jgi:hypothetical protein
MQILQTWTIMSNIQQAILYSTVFVKELPWSANWSYAKSATFLTFVASTVATCVYAIIDNDPTYTRVLTFYFLIFVGFEKLKSKIKNA